MTKKTPNVLKLTKSQLNKLSKDQIEGREPVYIKGVEGYLGGDGVWTSTTYINKMKKSHNWKY